MKCLIDFDGTLTNVQTEYKYIYDHLVRGFAQAGIPEQRFAGLYDHACEILAADPARYGWLDNGRITAFSDEDVFMKIIAGVEIIDKWLASGDPLFDDVRQAFEAKGIALMQLAEDCYQKMNREPLDAFNSPDPEVVSALRTMLDRDCEIVIVSNSPADRIIDKLEFAGLKPVAHDDNPSARFRVLGNAKKYALDDTPQIVSFGTRTIDIARSNYARIINDEHPQVIVGDVFSIDLALPIEMARKSPMVYEDLQIYLRTRSYTPQWAINCILNPKHGCPAAMRLLNHFADLPKLMLRR